MGQIPSRHIERSSEPYELALAVVADAPPNGRLRIHVQDEFGRVAQAKLIWHPEPAKVDRNRHDMHGDPLGFSFAAITSGKIDIEAFDPPSRSIDKQTNAALPRGSIPTGAHGAVLGVASTDIFDVVIHTAGTVYAPPVLETFTGHGSPQLDVVLFSTVAATASGSTEFAPTSPTAVTAFIMGQSWPIEAKRAILTIVTTLGYLKRPLVPLMQGVRGDLEGMLRRLRIDPESDPLN